MLPAEDGGAVCAPQRIPPKAVEPDFPPVAIEAAGAVLRGRSAWNGIAILVRDAEPVLTRVDRGHGDAADRRLDLAGLTVGRISREFGVCYKVPWLKRLGLHAAGLLASGAPLVLLATATSCPRPRTIL